MILPMRFKTLLALAFIVLLPGCGSSSQKEHLISGRTMGTTYHIKVVAPSLEDMAGLQVKIDQRLEQINQSMSTFRPDSEISRFNALTAIKTPFKVSPDFLRVMLSAREIYHLTGGAWDGTVNPLVNLWGFGHSGPLQHLPPEEAVKKALGEVGFDQIVVDPTGTLSKTHPHVSVDLASIAKGYGVDQVAVLLHNNGYKNFLVEIGGEVYAAGQRHDGKSWHVGINQPKRDAPLDAVYGVVTLRNAAMATSGDYRNFYQLQGHAYSHIIDPRTGHPIQNGVVSASVVADNCTLADGLATAMMVMGPVQGLDLLNQLEGIEGLVVVRKPDGKLENFPSAGLSGLAR